MRKINIKENKMLSWVSIELEKDNTAIPEDILFYHLKVWKKLHNVSNKGNGVTWVIKKNRQILFYTILIHFITY